MGRAELRKTAARQGRRTGGNICCGEEDNGFVPSPDSRGIYIGRTGFSWVLEGNVREERTQLWNIWSVSVRENSI